MEALVQNLSLEESDEPRRHNAWVDSLHLDHPCDEWITADQLRQSLHESYHVRDMSDEEMIRIYGKEVGSNVPQQRLIDWTGPENSIDVQGYTVIWMTQDPTLSFRWEKVPDSTMREN